LVLFNNGGNSRVMKSDTRCCARTILYRSVLGIFALKLNSDCIVLSIDICDDNDKLTACSDYYHTS
jgi:hypothetical protein